MSANANLCSIRRASPDDAHELAQLHWDSWVATYSGIFVQATFDAFPLAARESLWRSTALVMQHAPEKQQQLLIAVSEDDNLQPSIAGMAWVGPLRANGGLLPAATRGELWALYVRPEGLRRGVGTVLWNAARQWLQGAGFGEMYVWVLAKNPGAIAFYRAQGCTREGSRVFTADGVAVDEECWRIDLPAAAPCG